MSYNTELFIKKAKEIRKNSFDYSKVQYINSRTPVTIICNSCGKEFKQTPERHLKNRFPCANCYNKGKGQSQRRTLEQFLEECDKTYGDLYDYSRIVEYTTSKNSISIGCNRCGLVFKSTPARHLNSFNGCPQCSETTRKLNVKLSLSDFITKADKVHNNKYNYSKSSYISSRKPLIIICPEHGEFKQKPNTHLNGSGCPECSVNNVGPSLLSFKNRCTKTGRALLYLIKCFNCKEVFCKIGISSTVVEKRFSTKKAMPYDYKIIKVLEASPEIIFSLEETLINEFVTYNYIPEIHFSGHTECFNIKAISKLFDKIAI